MFTAYPIKAEEELYKKSLLVRKIPVPIADINGHMNLILETIIASKNEGKCIVEGFMKPGSTKLLSHSSGIVKCDYIIFEVKFECMVCLPTEGMFIKCLAINITKAGIRAETGDAVTPVVIFIARDQQHYMSKYFANIQEQDEITVKVIGKRFELNDKYISLIAELVEPKQKTPHLELDAAGRKPESRVIKKKIKINCNKK